MRFCSRCGFNLSAVDALLAQEQALAAPVQGFLAGPSPRQLGIRFGMKLIFVSAVLTPVLLAFSILFDTPAPLLLPLTVFLAGLFRAIYAALFEERTPSPQHAPAALPWKGSYTPPLPPHYSAPLAAPGGRALNTGEVVQPPSVTEHTTRFLEDK